MELKVGNKVLDSRGDEHTVIAVTEKEVATRYETGRCTGLIGIWSNDGGFFDTRAGTGDFLRAVLEF